MRSPHRDSTPRSRSNEPFVSRSKPDDRPPIRPEARGDHRSQRPFCRERRRRLHRHPPHRRRRHGRTRANARIRHRSPVRRPCFAARLRARRRDPGRPGRAQVEGEIRKRRSKWRRPADPDRRRQRSRARRGPILLPDHGRIYGLCPGGCRQDDRALATRLMDSRQFRQRRRGQGQYRLDPRRRNGAQAMGLLAPCPRRRP